MQVWRKVLFWDEYQICLHHHDGCDCVWQDRGDCKLPACIWHHHAGPSPEVMVLCANGCMSRSPFVHIDGMFNNGHHFYCVQNCGSILYLMSSKRYSLARLQLTGWLLFDTKNVWLLPWPSRSPDFSSIENVSSKVAERLARHYTPVATVDVLWPFLKLPGQLYLHMPRNLCTTQYNSNNELILPLMVILCTDFLGPMHPNFLKILSIVIFNIIHLFNEYHFVSCISSWCSNFNGQ